MPELPEVETICRGLAKSLVGKRIAKVEQRRRDLRNVLPENLPARLEGQTVAAITRRAKYILIFLAPELQESKNGGEVLLLHLGMSGRLLITPKAAPAEKHDHLVFHFDDRTCVRFNDPRRFGGCDLVKAADLPQHKWFKHLGIEPFDKKFTAAWLWEKFRGKTAPVKNAIMDQRLVTGIGNIYAAEALFHAGISPKRKAGSCTAAQLARLVPAIRKVLRAAIAAGGSSLRDYRQTDGELGYFQHKLAVYGREGEACPGCTCDIRKTGGIQRIAQGGRSTFYCKTRQH
jgi:formamidopyrimidine-DNA glycosylase